MIKTLYFEGCGMHDERRWNDVHNCRLRTAFRNNEGKAFYLELTAAKALKEWFGKKYKGTEFEKVTAWPYYAHIDFCFELSDDPDVDDCNANTHPCARNVSYSFPWELEEICKFVNETFGCSFDEVKVSDLQEAYCVYRRVYKNTLASVRFGDEYSPNLEHTKDAQRIWCHFYDLEKAALAKEGRYATIRHPNFSCWRDADKTHLLYLRNNHFKGVVYPSPVDLNDQEAILSALEFTF